MPTISSHNRRLQRLTSTTALLVMLALLASSAGQTVADEGTEFFEAKIRPVLIENCYKCHSMAAQ
ncbi:MAG: hypothetical protein VB912_00290, partial [Pirellulaceae bacterium]